MSDSITITIKAPGSPPQIIEGVAGFTLVYLPEKDPEYNTSFVAAGVNPGGIGKIGLWLIDVAKRMAAGTLNQGTMPPLGHDRALSAKQKKILAPTMEETKQFSKKRKY